MSVAVRMAKGELIYILDSDDELLLHSLDTLNREWIGLGARRNEYSGICGLCIDPQGRIIGDPFPEDIFDSNALELFFKWKIRGEKAGCVSRTVMLRFPFPDIDGFVQERIIWWRIAEHYLTRYINTPLRVYHTSRDSITRSRRCLVNRAKHTPGEILDA